MRSTSWLTRAALVCALSLPLAASAARADDDPAAEATKEAVAAKELAAAKEAVAAKAAVAAKQAVAAAKEAAAAAAEEKEEVRVKLKHAYGMAGRAPYWLNLQLQPVPKALDAQLNLHGQGVLVGHVGKDGPAAKAGVQENDILLAVGETPVTSAAALLEAVAKGQEISIKLMRGGQTMSVTLKPDKYPAFEKARKEAREFNLDLHDIKDLAKIEQSLREKLKDAGADFRLQLIQPGRVLPPGAQWVFDGHELPDDFTLDVHKEGKKPAEIHVRKGDKNWTVKENELSQLPEDVRRMVEADLGRGPMHFNIRVPQPPQPAVEPVPPSEAVPAPAGKPRPGEVIERAERRSARAAASLERRVEELNRDLDRMRQRMEELRKGLREERDADE